MTKSGIDPASVENVAQQFDMIGLLEGDIDAAEAMTYNEYAQVLEAINPATGKLYTPDDFNVISYENEGVGMLQDAIWADGTRLSDPAYNDTAVEVRGGLAAGLGVLPRQRRGVRTSGHRQELDARSSPTRSGR